MLYNKIFNPMTRRWVKLGSNTGRNILINYILSSTGGSEKHVHFDDLATEWDEKCNQNDTYEKCIEGEHSFYCRWRTGNNAKCISVEHDDLEDLYWEKKDAEYELDKELSIEEQEKLNNHNKILKMMRGPEGSMQSFNIDGLKSLKLDGEDSIHTNRNIRCHQGEINKEKCPSNGKIWEYPCYHDGKCWRENPESEFSYIISK